jgi:beta-glucosidase
MYVTREINAADAFVAAWLPGTEGGGIADLLFRKKDGSVAYDFRGRLSFSWPRSPNQTPLNVPGPGATAADWAAYNPLFAFDYGMDYAHPNNLGTLPEAPSSELVAANEDTYVKDGHAAAPFKMFLLNADNAAVSADDANAAPGGALTIAHTDTYHQEDTLVATWTGAAKATLAVSGSPIDLSRQTNGDMALHIDVKVDKAPTSPVLFGMACGDTCRGAVDLTQMLTTAKPGTWTALNVRLSCLRTGGAKMNAITAPFALSTASPMVLSVTDVKLAPGEGPPSCPTSPQT